MFSESMDILLYMVAMMAQKMDDSVPEREEGCFAGKGCKDRRVCQSSALAA